MCSFFYQSILSSVCEKARQSSTFCHSMLQDFQILSVSKCWCTTFCSRCSMSSPLAPCKWEHSYRKQQLFLLSINKSGIDWRQAIFGHLFFFFKCVSCPVLYNTGKILRRSFNEALPIFGVTLKSMMLPGCLGGRSIVVWWWSSECNLGKRG